jgi:hypothetical protein
VRNAVWRTTGFLDLWRRARRPLEVPFVSLAAHQRQTTPLVRQLLLASSISVVPVHGSDNGGGYLAKFGVLLGVQLWGVLFVVQLYAGASLLNFPRRKLIDPSVDFTIHIQFLLGGPCADVHFFTKHGCRTLTNGTITHFPTTMHILTYMAAYKKLTGLDLQICKVTTPRRE